MKESHDGAAFSRPTSPCDTTSHHASACSAINLHDEGDTLKIPTITDWGDVYRDHVCCGKAAGTSHASFRMG
jgi:hypothetical protein